MAEARGWGHVLLKKGPEDVASNTANSPVTENGHFSAAGRKEDLKKRGVE